jgi:Mg-chelatase subunit ChlD
MRYVFIIFFLLAGCAALPTGVTDTDRKADELYNTAAELEKAGNFTESVRKYREASKLGSLKAKYRIHRMIESGKNKGIVLAIAIDVSGSMSQADTKKILISTVWEEIKRLSAESRVSIVLFNSKIVFETPFFAVGDEHALKEVLSHVRAIPYKGVTDIGRALAAADKALSEESGGRKAGILITDGKINTLTATGDNISRREIEKGVRNAPFFTVALNSSEVGSLNRLSDGTGGRSYRAEKAENLPRLLADIFKTVQGIENYLVFEDDINLMVYTDKPSYRAGEDAVLSAYLVDSNKEPLRGIEFYSFEITSAEGVQLMYSGGKKAPPIGEFQLMKDSFKGKIPVTGKAVHLTIKAHIGDFSAEERITIKK